MRAGAALLALLPALLSACAAPGTSREPGAEDARAEVEELHAFFEAWFAGRLPPTDEAFARFADALADGFVLVDPRGRRTERAALLAALRAAHGSRADDPLAIRVADVRLRPVADGPRPGSIWAGTYEEWHTTDAGERGRLSSVVLRAARGRPNGLEWLLVHETWLPDDSRGDEAPR